MKTAKCTKCELIKELNADNFYFKKDRCKWDKACIKCRLAVAKKRYSEKSEEIKEKAAIYRSLNREIINKKAAIYNSKKETKDRAIKYRQKNKKLFRKKEREWRLKNPEKYKAIAYRKHKKQSKKPHNRVRTHVSRQVYSALRRVGASKLGNSVLKFLPYTIYELKQHLESQFESWMNWSNWGVYNSKTWNDNDQSTWTWNIDHIIPQSKLPYDSMEHENFKKCWVLENLRPYSAKQNVLDGANRTRHK